MKCQSRVAGQAGMHGARRCKGLARNPLGAVGTMRWSGLAKNPRSAGMGRCRSPGPPVATVGRLTQAGVALVERQVIVLEAMVDNTHPKASEIYATLPAGLMPTGWQPPGSGRSVA
jgi:hypothetical protein